MAQRWKWAVASVAVIGLVAAIGCAAAGAQSVRAQVSAPVSGDMRARLPQDEVIYFALVDRFANGDTANDTGGISGGRLDHGFDPTHKGFYHGGDLAGLTQRLDYIQGMGVTAIWLAPIYHNRAVQGAPGAESAGYHGYWITDFTGVDPHFGDRVAFRAFMDAAHARGMKVYLDIITNHTADVIQYRECPQGECVYRGLADFPYTRQGGLDGPEINAGFLGDDAARQTESNFARLTNPNYAYTPFLAPQDESVKVPAWLNDVIYYHNRGNTTWTGESSTYGDFANLDDLFTEHPRVVAGMIDIYGDWIDEFGVDGFRIDTAKHVNPEFWMQFIPAMQARAEANGIPNFHIFGEVYDPDPAGLARHTRVDRLPTVLDFGFQSAATEVIARGAGTDRLARLFAADALYEGGAAAAIGMPTFLGNHDMGRFSTFVRQANPGASPEEELARVTLAHVLMMTARGVPTIYYGDEQGFVGDGGDQDARETLFASRVAVYNDNRLIGTSRTTAVDNYNTSAPLYLAIAELSRLRANYPALRRGTQIVRAYGAAPGLFAFSRIYGNTEVLVAINTSEAALEANVIVDAQSNAWTAAAGRCPQSSSAPGSLRVTLPALGYAICVAERP
jgi:glycosidase